MPNEVNQTPVPTETASARRGARVDTCLPGEDSVCRPLAPMRVAEPFEEALS